MKYETLTRVETAPDYDDVDDDVVVVFLPLCPDDDSKKLRNKKTAEFLQKMEESTYHDSVRPFYHYGRLEINAPVSRAPLKSHQGIYEGGNRKATDSGFMCSAPDSFMTAEQQTATFPIASLASAGALYRGKQKICYCKFERTIR